jgi:medium-chain acyl-[acyl-carrier-protein] hydrolase
MGRRKSAFDHWFKGFGPPATPDFRLVCFPHVGGSAWSFRKWSDELPSLIEVRALQMPGRDTRFAEPPILAFATLVDTVSAVVASTLDVPTAFFGHSVGALVAFEVARRLRRTLGISPIALFVSAHRAPHLADPDLKDIHLLPESALLEKLRALNGTPQAVLDDGEFLRLLIPTLRADFQLAASYRYLAGDGPLPCPIYAFGGVEDPRVSRSDLEAWRMHTAARFTVDMFPGDHFYLYAAQLDVVRKIHTQVATSSTWEQGYAATHG